MYVLESSSEKRHTIYAIQCAISCNAVVLIFEGCSIHILVYTSLELFIRLFDITTLYTEPGIDCP